MTQKYIPSNNDKAIYIHSNGFYFGNNILTVEGSPLNADNRGSCNVGKNNFYDIEADSKGESPLTGEKGKFTCVELEVYKVDEN